MKHFLPRPLSLLLSLALLLGLCACQPKADQHIQGLVTQVQTSPEGKLLSFVLQPEEGEPVGVLLTEETHVSPSGSMSGTAGEFWQAFQAELQPDTEVAALCFSAPKTLTGQDGQEYSAYEGYDVNITGHLVRGGATLNDGTALDVLESAYPLDDRTYYLPDGVKLLTVSAPTGPAHSYTVGQESLDDFSEAAREKVLAYYEARGPLYDEAQELELTYASQKAMGEAYQCHYLDQHVSPSASSSRVMYFLTTVTLPTDHGDTCTSYELRVGDAFDRETGEHLDPWDLFTCPRAEVLSALLKAVWVPDILQPEIEAAFTPERIVLFPDSISVNFERGSLPSRSHDYFLSASLADLPGLLQDWAIPTAPDPQ